MKKTVIILILMIFSFVNENIFAQTPAYKLTAKNFSIYPDNKLIFDIWLQSNDTTTFEYAGGEYNLYFNPDIANGGSLSVVFIDSELPVNLRPVNPEIVWDEGFPNVIKLGQNAFPGPGNGFVIPELFPGKLIARVMLTTSAASFKLTHGRFGIDLFANPDWNDSPQSVNASKIYAYSNGSLQNVTTPATHYVNPPGLGYCGSILQLRLLEEGLYNASLNTYNRKDSITVFLRNVNSPYSIVDSSKGAIDTVNLFGTFYFTNAPTGTYYIVMKHLNSLETWGMDTIRKNDCNGMGEWFTNTFDFSTSPAKAYGNNLVLKGSEYCFYNGDVDQNRLISSADLIFIHNDLQNFVTGYVNTDINGDNIVDLQDLLMTKKNSDDFVMAITP